MHSKGKGNEGKKHHLDTRNDAEIASWERQRKLLEAKGFHVQRSQKPAENLDEAMRTGTTVWEQHVHMPSAEDTKLRAIRTGKKDLGEAGKAAKEGERYWDTAKHNSLVGTTHSEREILMHDAGTIRHRNLLLANRGLITTEPPELQTLQSHKSELKGLSLAMWEQGIAQGNRKLKSQALGAELAIERIDEMITQKRRLDPRR